MSGNGEKLKGEATAMRGKVRLSNIAEAAGVSTATVSRALNTPALVTPATRAAIEDAVRRLRYIPDGAARTLASRRSRTVGAIVPSITNAISAQTIETFQNELETARYALLLTSSEYDSRSTRHQAEVMMERGIDALLIVTLKDDPQLYLELENMGLPFVVTMPHETVPFVGYDHEEAELKMLNFLLELGHRDIGFVVSAMGRSDRLTARVAAVRRIFAERGLEFGDSRLVEVEHSNIGAGREALKLLQARGRLPTAVMASDDNLAAGLIFECLRQGISVPGDLSVGGYGDMDIARHITPALTTVRTPKAAIGRQAAHYLLSQLSGGEEPAHQLLQTELVVRETSGKPHRDHEAPRGGGPATTSDKEAS